MAQWVNGPKIRTSPSKRTEFFEGSLADAVAALTITMPLITGYVPMYFSGRIRIGRHVAAIAGYLL